MERRRRFPTERVSGIRVRECSSVHAHNNLRLVQQGQNWTDIGDAINRPPAECRDRFQRHLSHADTRRRGKFTTIMLGIIDYCAGSWSTDEETRLIRIMQDLSEHGKTPATSNKFWEAVSDQMDKTRSAKQCCNKWYDSLTVYFVLASSSIGLIRSPQPSGTSRGPLAGGLVTLRSSFGSTYARSK